MDFEKLAQEILSAEEIKNVDDSWRLLENEGYEAFFDTNIDIISEILFLDSYSDFLVFLKEGELNRTIFMCAWMEKNEKCIEIGGYEDNIQNKVVSYLAQKIDSAEFLDTITGGKEIFSDFDGEDNFKDYIRNINVQLVDQGMQFILFFNDIYVQCSYYLFLFDRTMANKLTKEWDDSDIELVLL